MDDGSQETRPLTSPKLVCRTGSQNHGLQVSIGNYDPNQQVQKTVSCMDLVWLECMTLLLPEP